MKILITGGAGFIGSHIAEFYDSNRYEVFILDNLETGKGKMFTLLTKNTSSMRV